MVSAMTRIVVIDPQPAVRAGLAMMLRTEPGLVPVGAAVGAHDGLELVSASARTSCCSTARRRRLGAVPAAACARAPAPRVVLYAAGDDPTLPVTARVAGADGLVHKAAPAEELFEALRLVGRGGSALPPLDREQLDAAAHRVEPEDLALLAMLVDRTEPADVAATLRLDRRKLAQAHRARARAPALAAARPRPA